jgi:hypothetical protein
MLRNNGRHNYRSPLIAQGPVPSLVFDFAGTRTLDPRITFTRSSTATYTNSSGVLTSAAIDVPRFTYNPTTLQSLGLYVEESSTNILLNSLLDGTNLNTQTVTTTATPYTLSFYGTGTIVLAGTNISTQIGTGAYPSRKIFTFTPTAGALTLTVTGTVQYAQLETGSKATSFIPTAGSQVTRALDNPRITGSNFSSWYNASQGTAFIDAIFGNTSGAATGFVFYNTSTTNDYWQVLAIGSNQAGGKVSGSYVSLNIGQPQLNTSAKVAFAVSNGTWAASVNGGNAVTTSANIPQSINSLYLGTSNQGNFYLLNGTISKFTYYSTALTSDQLKSLTT